MSSANLNSYMKEHLKRQPRTLSMSQIEELIEYDAWLESRSPTLRAPVQPAIELLRRLRAQFDGCDDSYIVPLLQEVDAVLKTAGGG